MLSDDFLIVGLFLKKMCVEECIPAAWNRIQNHYAESAKQTDNIKIDKIEQNENAEDFGYY